MMTRYILSNPIFKCASLEEVLKHFANKKNYDSPNDAMFFGQDTLQHWFNLDKADMLILDR
jgi:hypothetical protein